MDGKRQTLQQTDMARQWFLPRGRIAAVLVPGLLALSWVITYVAGGAGKVAPHWFYVPILLSAYWFGRGGASLAAVASGILVGPLMPADVERGLMQSISDWGTRAAFFLIIGMAMAALVRRAQLGVVHEADALERERDLLREKNAVMDTVSHEFRTPLTAIRGVMETLAQRELVADAARPLVEAGQNATKRLADLVELVLAATGALDGGNDATQMTRLNLTDLCTAIGDELAPLGGRERLIVVAGPEGERIWADRTLVPLALRCIIDNALKFSPPGTPVEVRASLPARCLEIRVRDRGPGLDPSFESRAWHPLTQQDQSATRRAGGLGLGLFVARRAIERLGGEIRFERPPSGGLDVVLTIPQPERAVTGYGNGSLRSNGGRGLRT